MTTCFFVSDLHGRRERYAALLEALRRERPAALFLGGDLLPSGFRAGGGEGGFVPSFLAPAFRELRAGLGRAYPRVFLIPGNDDGRGEEPAFLAAQEEGLWQWAHGRRLPFGDYTVYGYACVPPTPFRLKDWERYDVSRYVDPGCMAPAEGSFTREPSRHAVEYGTIAKELAELVGEEDLGRAILLCHAPPYRTDLDRAALDGKRIDHVPLDVHIGSIALRRLIETRRPRVTLHGHVHESARLTGNWQCRLGRTVCLSAAHDGPELALVRFDPEHPERATRELVGG